MNKPLILVVEDDTPVRNLITTTLKAHDYRFLTAANGESAVLEASSHNPEIILLDLGLPDMDGVEVIHKVRSWSNMPIIVISARSEDTDKIDALDAGADDYLTKPFSVEELLARLRVTQRRLSALQIGSVNTDAIFTNGKTNKNKSKRRYISFITNDFQESEDSKSFTRFCKGLKALCYINAKCGNPLCFPWSFIEDPFFYRFIQSCNSPAVSSSSSSSSSLCIPFSDSIISLFSSLDFASLEAFLFPFPRNKLDFASQFNPQSTSSPDSSSSSTNTATDSSSSSAFSPSVHFFPFPHYSGFQDRAASFFDLSDGHPSMYQWDDFAFTLQNQSYTSLLYKLLVRFF